MPLITRAYRYELDGVMLLLGRKIFSLSSLLNIAIFLEKTIFDLKKMLVVLIFLNIYRTMRTNAKGMDNLIELNWFLSIKTLTILNCCNNIFLKEKNEWPIKIRDLQGFLCLREREKDARRQRQSLAYKALVNVSSEPKKFSD